MTVKDACLTDYSIDLSAPATLSASDSVRQALSALDSNGDGTVRLNEAEFSALPAPVSDIDFFVENADDLAFYDELLASAFNATTYARFAGAMHGRFSSGVAEAEAQVIALHNDSEGTAVQTKRRDLTCLSFESAPGFTRFLFQKGDPNEGGFYFSVKFPAELNAGTVTPISVEFNGESYYLADLDFIGLKRDLLEYFLDVPLKFPQSVPPGFAERTRDYVEALNYQCGSLTNERLGYGNYVPPTPSTSSPAGPAAPPDTRPQEILELKKTWVLENGNPVVSTLQVQGPVETYDVGIRAQGLDKALLSSEETKILESVLTAVPPTLYGALAANGVMTGFSVEVIEDDVFDFSMGSGAVGQYFGKLHKFVIRRSALGPNSVYGFEDLKEVFTHELAHGLFPHSPEAAWYDQINPFYTYPIVWDEVVNGANPNFPESSSDYFLNATWQELAERARTERKMPAPSVYSLYSVAELLAECAVAYLTGETDPNPYGALNGGHLSRAELREKLPKIYLAMRLFFEADSAYFGDLNAFNWEFKGFYDEVLASPERERYLSHDATAEELAYAYDYMTYFGVLPPAEY